MNKYKKIRIAIEAIYIVVCLFYLMAVVFTASNEDARLYSTQIAVTFMVVVIIRTIAIELLNYHRNKYEENKKR